MAKNVPVATADMSHTSSTIFLWSVNSTSTVSSWDKLNLLHNSYVNEIKCPDVVLVNNEKYKLTRTDKTSVVKHLTENSNFSVQDAIIRVLKYTFLLQRINVMFLNTT